MNNLIEFIKNTYDTSHFLVKSLFEERHAYSFLINGEMLLSRIDYFQKLEKNIRYDKDDGKVISNTKLLHGEVKSVPIGNGQTIEIKADMSKIDKRAMMFWVHSHDVLDFIYSMSAYENVSTYLKLKNKQINYGNYCVVITNELEFVNRFIYKMKLINREIKEYKIMSKIEREFQSMFERKRWKEDINIPHRHLWSYRNEDFFMYSGFGLVKYSDIKSKDEFTKRTKYKSDSEFRIAYNDTYASDLPIRIICKIGNLQDIAIKCSKENLEATLLLSNRKTNMSEYMKER